jgi:hypothetical protein
MPHPEIVPPNETGNDSNNEYSIQKNDASTARQLFQIAKQRLLNVNEWHQLTGLATAAFRLTDEKGNKVHRSAQLGDHLKIDIPGPGTVTGEGNDWVQIEAIEENATDDKEIIAIRVRPTSNPQNNKEDVAHFFSEEASSTFSVIRQANTVTAAVHGRNEKPNVETENIIDKVRNVIVAATAIAGMNKPQWKNLVKGLLSE